MKLFLPLLALTLLPTLAHAQSNLVVNSGSVSCTNVKGESGFNINSFSFGGSDAVSTIPKSGSGAGAGKPSLSNLTFSKSFDNCSEALIRSFLSAQNIPTLTLTQYRTTARATNIPVLTIALSNARIASYEITGANDVSPAESLSFAFTRVCVTSIAINTDGGTGATTRVCYDLATNILS